MEAYNQCSERKEHKRGVFNAKDIRKTFSSRNKILLFSKRGKLFGEMERPGNGKNHSALRETIFEL